MTVFALIPGDTAMASMFKPRVYKNPRLFVLLCLKGNRHERCGFNGTKDQHLEV